MSYHKLEWKKMNYYKGYNRKNKSYNILINNMKNIV